MSAILLATLVLATSCSSSKTSAAGPYAPDIKAAAGQANSDFERQVFSDGVITRQEYEEAYQRYVDCGKQQGVDIGLVDQGGWYISSVPTSPDSDQVIAECSKGTIALIGGIYAEMVRNPNKQDVDKLEFDCLRKSGVTPAGYTLAQYKADKSSAQNSGPQNTSPDYDRTHVFNAPPADPFPFDLGDPRYGACINNPVAPPTQ